MYYGTEYASIGLYSCVHAHVVKRLQQGLHPESVLLMSSDVMMERALSRDIIVIVNIIVLMAPMSSIVVSRFAIVYTLLGNTVI